MPGTTPRRPLSASGPIFRPTAVILAASLVLTAPGIPCYQAAAAVLRSSARAGVRTASPARTAVRTGWDWARRFGFSRGLRFFRGAPSDPGFGAEEAEPALRPAAEGLREASPDLAPAMDAELTELLADPEAMRLSAEEARAPAGEAWRAGSERMDRILRRRSVRGERLGNDPVLGAGWRSAGTLRALRLKDPAWGRSGRRTASDGPPPREPPPAPAGTAEPERKESLLDVLPNKGKNREFLKFQLGRALLQAGLSFQEAAMPGLATQNDLHPARSGYASGVHSAANAVSFLLNGRLVDRHPIRWMLGLPLVGSALALAAVPAAFFPFFSGAPALPLAFFALYLAAVFGSGFLRSIGGTAEEVASNHFLARNEASYNKAMALGNAVSSGASVVGFLAAGGLIAMAGSGIGHALTGHAAAYGVAAFLLLAVGLVFLVFLRVPRDASLEARQALLKRLKERKPRLYPRVRGVSTGWRDGEKVLLVELRGWSAREAKRSGPHALPEEFEGYQVRGAPVRNRLRDLLQGFRINWRDPFLRLTLLFSSLEYATSDAMAYIAVPRFISEGLGSASALPAGLTGLPVLGPFLSALTSYEGAFGLYMAAAALGAGLSSLLMMLHLDRPASDLEGRIEEFRAALTERLPGSPSLAEAAAQAVREATRSAVRRRQQAWRRGDGQAAVPSDLAEAILSRVKKRLRPEVAEEPKARKLSSLLSETGLREGLHAWSQRHFDALKRRARWEGRTGWDWLQRQGFWSSVLYGLGTLAYWGVFFSGGLWGSVGSLFLAALLQGPANAVWAGLYTRVLQERYPNDMGKVVAARFFLFTVLPIVGDVAFGVLASWSLGRFLLIAAAVQSLVALANVVEPFAVFPIGRKGRRRVKS